MRGGRLAVILCGLSILVLTDEANPDSTHSFPRNYFLHSLASKNQATQSKAITRAEREYADDPRMAETVIELLRRVHTPTVSRFTRPYV